MSMPLPTLEEIQDHILKKAAKDHGFRQTLLANSKAAIQRELASKYPGFPQLPAALEINVVEQSQNKIFVVLPPALPESRELTNEELENVAGGDNGYGVTCADAATCVLFTLTGVPPC